MGKLVNHSHSAPGICVLPTSVWFNLLNQSIIEMRCQLARSLDAMVSSHLLEVVTQWLYRIELRIEWSGFEHWSGLLCWVLGQYTLLSQCHSSPRSINGYWWTVGTTWQKFWRVYLRWTSIPSRESSNTPRHFMLWKPGHVGPSTNYYHWSPL